MDAMSNNMWALNEYKRLIKKYPASKAEKIIVRKMRERANVSLALLPTTNIDRDPYHYES